MKGIMKILIVFLSFLWITCQNDESPNLHIHNKIFQENTELPSVAILGTFHFAGTSDIASINVEDILSHRRQKEIKELLQRIKQFEPDKILLEVIFTKNGQLNQKYQNYLAGNFQLSENEIYQLGFRLAKMLKHQQVYAIDSKLDLQFDKLMEFAEKHKQKQKLDNFIKQLREKAQKESNYLKNHSLLQYFRQLNTDSADLWNKNLYLEETLDYNADTLYPGPELNGEWYKRNLYILANMDRVIEENDRILMIIGSGHRAIIKDFIQDRSDLSYVEINQYLK